MSIGFNWFKNYEIIDDSYRPYYEKFYIHYLHGDSTSHSSGNITKVQNLLKKYGGESIPTISEYTIHSVNEKLDLIKPEKMSAMCQKVLETTEVDEVDMRGRIEWFKKLSDKGYYLTYDCVY